MQAIKAAVIGTGRMGVRHIQALKEMEIEIAGICDLNLGALHMAGEKFQVPAEHRFVSARRLLSQTHPDLVIIATTADAHCDLTCRAAEAGARYILCETPMACSIRQCDRMIETAGRFGARLGVNHSRRYMPTFLEAQRILNSDEFGGLQSMSVIAGDIGLAMNGSHLFDAFYSLAGEGPEYVSAWLALPTEVNPRGARFIDAGGCVRITTTGGKRFFLDCSPDQGHRLMVVYAGPFGQLTVDDLAGTMFSTVRRADKRANPSTQYGLEAVDRVIECGRADIVRLCQSAVNSLLIEGEYPSGKDGMLAVQTLVAAHHSHASGNRAHHPFDPAAPSELVYPWA